MIEILYALVLGFAVIGNAVLTVSDTDRKWGFLALLLILVLPLVHIFTASESIGSVKAVMIYFIMWSVTTHLGYFLIGSIAAILLVLYEEGTFGWVWRRVHPVSAPTENIKAGNRGRQLPQKNIATSATFMGTSTGMFNVQGLDVKTVALVRLALAAFGKVDRSVVIGIESSLKLGDGRRYKAFHQLVGESQRRRQNVKDIIHPYWREINGNHASARNMFTALCQLARDTRNTDRKTINRLANIGQALGLSPEDMGLAIGQVRV